MCREYLLKRKFNLPMTDGAAVCVGDCGGDGPMTDGAVVCVDDCEGDRDGRISDGVAGCVGDCEL
jgi:hypothetical protein